MGGVRVGRGGLDREDRERRRICGAEDVEELSTITTEAGEALSEMQN
jgi:hypothetical protein